MSGVMEFLLPHPRIRRDVMSVEEALAYRRSIRSFRGEPVKIEQLSQLLWATYGVTLPRRGFKTAPSAGATYPLEVYVVVKPRSVEAGQGEFVAPGSYKYSWRKHSLQLVKEGDLSRDLMRACLNQSWVGAAPVNIVLAAVFERTTRYYGERGVRYVYLDTGHVGQNIYLEATALGLGTVAIGAFIDEEVKRVVGMAEDEDPVYVFPVGVPAREYRVSEEELREFIEKNRRVLS